MNFEINACDFITADYTIIMSKKLEVMGNHVMCERSALFLRVVMSSLCAFYCLLALSKQAKT